MSGPPSLKLCHVYSGVITYAENTDNFLFHQGRSRTDFVHCELYGVDVLSSEKLKNFRARVNAREVKIQPLHRRTREGNTLVYSVLLSAEGLCVNQMFSNNNFYYLHLLPNQCYKMKIVKAPVSTNFIGLQPAECPKKYEFKKIFRCPPELLNFKIGTHVIVFDNSKEHGVRGIVTEEEQDHYLVELVDSIDQMMIAHHQNMSIPTEYDMNFVVPIVKVWINGLDKLNATAEHIKALEMHLPNGDINVKITKRLATNYYEVNMYSDDMGVNFGSLLKEQFLTIVYDNADKVLNASSQESNPEFSEVVDISSDVSDDEVVEVTTDNLETVQKQSKEKGLEGPVQSKQKGDTIVEGAAGCAENLMEQPEENQMVAVVPDAACSDNNSAPAAQVLQPNGNEMLAVVEPQEPKNKKRHGGGPENKLRKLKAKPNYDSQCPEALQLKAQVRAKKKNQRKNKRQRDQLPAQPAE